MVATNITVGGRDCKRLGMGRMKNIYPGCRREVQRTRKCTVVFIGSRHERESSQNNLLLDKVTFQKEDSRQINPDRSLQIAMWKTGLERNWDAREGWDTKKQLATNDHLR